MGLYVVNLETGTVFQAVEGEYTRPAWSRDGLKLAFDRRDHGLEEIWMLETRTLAAIKPFGAGMPEAPKAVLFSNRVLRGGAWDFPAWDCRSANRNENEPGNRILYLGFRVALISAE